MAIGETPADRDLLGPLNGQVVVPPPSDPAAQRPSPSPERAPLHVVYGDHEDDGFTLAEDAALLRPDKRQMLLDAGHAAMPGLVPSASDRDWLRSVIDEDHEDEFLSKIQNNDRLTPASMFGAMAATFRDDQVEQLMSLPVEWRVEQLEEQAPGIKALAEEMGLDPRTGLRKGEQGPERGETEATDLSRQYPFAPAGFQQALSKLGGFFNELDKFEYSSVARGIRALGDIAWWSEERIGDLQQAMGEGARESLVAEEWPQLRHDDPALLDEQMGQKERGRALQARMRTMEQNLPGDMVVELDRTVGASLNAPTRIRALQHMAALLGAMDAEAERYIAEHLTEDRTLQSGLTTEQMIDKHLGEWVSAGTQAIHDHFGDPKKQILIEGLGDPLNVIDLFDPFGGPLPVLAMVRKAGTKGVGKALSKAAANAVSQRRAAIVLTDFRSNVAEMNRANKGRRLSIGGPERVEDLPYLHEDDPIRRDIPLPSDEVVETLRPWGMEDVNPAMVEEVNRIRQAAGEKPIEILSTPEWTAQHRMAKEWSELGPQQPVKDHTRWLLHPAYQDGWKTGHGADPTASIFRDPLSGADLAELSAEELTELAQGITYTEQLGRGKQLLRKSQDPNAWSIANLDTIMGGVADYGATTYAPAKPNLAPNPPHNRRTKHGLREEAQRLGLNAMYGERTFESHHMQTGGRNRWAVPDTDGSSAILGGGWFQSLGLWKTDEAVNLQIGGVTPKSGPPGGRWSEHDEILAEVALPNADKERAPRIQRLFIDQNTSTYEPLTRSDILGVQYDTPANKGIHVVVGEQEDWGPELGLAGDPIFSQQHKQLWIVFDENGIPVGAMRTQYNPHHPLGELGRQYDIGRRGPEDAVHEVETLAVDNQGKWVEINELKNNWQRYGFESADAVESGLTQNVHGRYVGHIDNPDTPFLMQFPNTNDLDDARPLGQVGDALMAQGLHEGHQVFLARNHPGIMEQVGDTGLNAANRPYGGRPIVATFNGKQYVRLRQPRAQLAALAFEAIQMRMLTGVGGPNYFSADISKHAEKVIRPMLEGTASSHHLMESPLKSQIPRDPASRTVTGMQTDRVWDEQAARWMPAHPEPVEPLVLHSLHTPADAQGLAPTVDPRYDEFVNEYDDLMRTT